MASPTVIAVDVDDVCADLIGEWVLRYNQRFGDCITPDQIRGWEIDQFLPKATKAQVFKILEDPDLYDGIWPVPGALQTVQSLRQLGRVVFVTACHAGLHAKSKYDWLKRNGFDPQPRDFIAAQDKALIRADFLFDDNVDNAENFGGVGAAIVMPHNAARVTFVPKIPFVQAPELVQAYTLKRKNVP